VREPLTAGLSFTTFFSLLSAYYVLRPLRDEIAVRAGVGKIPWLFTATLAGTLLLIPLFGWLVSRCRRRAIAPLAFAACAVLLLVFHGGLRREDAVSAVVFFVFISVFNLFIVSVFWSLMAETWNNAQARRRYGFVAAGGTCGAIAGPSMAALLAERIAPANLLFVSAALMTVAAIAATVIALHAGDGTSRSIGGSILAGLRVALRSRTLLRIALLVICYTTISTILYLEQADIVGRTIRDAGARTRYFALVDLMVNTVTVGAQLLVTSRLMTRFGLALPLTLVPLVLAAGMAVLAAAPELMVVAVLLVIHRSGEFAFTRPAREVLYTGVGAEERFKGKNVIDTLVYRANDAAVAWAIGAMHAAGAATLAIAAAGIAVAAGWAANGFALGRKHDLAS
jgi:ATP:ADP antiporter, AAA family